MRRGLRRECEAAGFIVESVGYESVGKDLKIVTPSNGKDHASIIAVKPLNIEAEASGLAWAPTCAAQVVSTAVNPAGAGADFAGLRATVRAMLAAELEMAPEDIDDEMSFIDMGLDSITSVSWFKKINTRFGLSLPATKVYDFPNVTQFAGFLFAQLQDLTCAPENSPNSGEYLKTLLRQVQDRQMDTDEANRRFQQMRQFLGAAP